MSHPLSWPLVGNTLLGRTLLDAWQSKTLPAVMVWRGPANVGKATAARWLAQTALCQQPTAGPCRSCSSCRQVAAGSHPALVALAGTPEAPITIDQVRQAAQRFRLTTVGGEDRWWIITDANYLTEGATNAVLKFFEEPPSDLHIILTTAQPDRLLPTVLSRAALYYWHTVPDEEMAVLRPSTMAVTQWQAHVARAAGRPGYLHYALQPSFEDVESEYRDLLVQAMITGQPVRLSRQLTPATVTAMLATWELVIRELLLARTGVRTRRLWPHHQGISQLAENLHLTAIIRLVERYLNRYQLLTHNVQPRFILEDLQLV